MEIRQAYTFDDVMLVPAASNILPGDTDTRTRITREIDLGIPLKLIRRGWSSSSFPFFQCC